MVGRGHMVSATARAYNAGLGEKPSAGSRDVQGQIPSSGVRGGEVLLKLKAFEQICQLLCILQILFVIKQHRPLQTNFNQFTA